MACRPGHLAERGVNPWDHSARRTGLLLNRSPDRIEVRIMRGSIGAAKSAWNERSCYQVPNKHNSLVNWDFGRGDGSPAPVPHFPEMSHLRESSGCQAHENSDVALFDSRPRASFSGKLLPVASRWHVVTASLPLGQVLRGDDGLWQRFATKWAIGSASPSHRRGHEGGFQARTRNERVVRGRAVPVEIQRVLGVAAPSVRNPAVAYCAQC
jgi:hypothetical protein